MNAREFTLNNNALTLEELAPYFEHHVAWSADGKKILAHGKEWEDVLRETQRLGLKGGEYVLDYIMDPAKRYLGGWGSEL